MKKRKFGASGMVSGILLPMGLICVFAFCSLALALMGGTAYKSIQANINKAYDGIVASSYLRTKVNQNNNSGAVSLREMEGVQVLVIQGLSAEGESRYETRVYLYEGELRESFVPSSVDFKPGSGTVIAQLSRCVFSISEKGLFEAEIESERGATRVAVALVGGGA